MASSRFMFRYVNGIPIYNIWDNDFGVIREGKFLQLFESQISTENVNIHNLCIFDCTNEGIGTNDIEIMMDAISASFPNLEVRVLFNISTAISTAYRHICFPEHMVAHCGFVKHVGAMSIDWENIAINKHFISLQRRASVTRARFTKKLLSTFDKHRYIISCGSHPNKWLRELPGLKEAFHPYKMPILVDGTIDSDSEQHFHTNVNFFECMVNVITETSSQTDADSWREIFLTEKTFKAFAYRQMPLWFAVPNTVQTVRDLGFDVFDDIIDHSYDLIEDESERMDAVVNVLDGFCNTYPTNEELNKLRVKLWQRISNNMQLLDKLASVHRITKHNHILELIK